MPVAMRYMVFVLLGLCLGVANAQPSAEHALRLGWGTGYLLRQDLSFSRMIHRDISPLQFWVVYERSQKLQHLTSVRFGRYLPRVGEPFDFRVGSDGPVHTTSPHSFVMVDLHKGLATEILNGEKIHLSVGGSSRIRLWPSTYNFANAYSFGYYFSLGLELWIRTAFSLGDHSVIQADLYAPFLAFNARNPYMSQDDWFFEDNLAHRDVAAFINFMKRGEFQSWGKSRSLDIHLHYGYRISGDWQVGVHYQLSMVYNRVPTMLHSFEHALFLTIQLHF